MWIARDGYSGNLWLFTEKKPYKMEPYFDAWGSDDGQSKLLDSTGTLFPEVQWTDEEPTEIEITIKR